MFNDYHCLKKKKKCLDRRPYILFINVKFLSLQFVSVKKETRYKVKFFYS